APWAGGLPGTGVERVGVVAGAQGGSRRAGPRPVAQACNRVAGLGDRAMSAASEAFRRHWPEYLMEAAGLAAFMVSACFFAVLLEPAPSPVRGAPPAWAGRGRLCGVSPGGSRGAVCRP